ncbi:hypothetical protein [Methylobacterium aquaticum]|uniref:ASCH domain-containing protein n=1 Tax=Methylobacterium aquaticum TaxID=270351 RepID=A0A0C6F7S1_9HYPH|nr:hypothetical protein [Methylobacterium aquaticum]BAQ44383.1 hypothetical protein Maq22A_c04900 [Methylobacterium aquaticum]
MVAYSFTPRFEVPILEGRKTRTIRAIGRRRHARPGEELQLYVGMQTSACRLLARRSCSSVVPVRLVFGTAGLAELFEVDGAPIAPAAMEAFARADGFEDTGDMARFWFATHAKRGTAVVDFAGLMVSWA